MIGQYPSKTIIRCILILFLGLMFCSHKERSQEKKVFHVSKTTWKNFRGDSNLRGRSNDILPDSLILLWSSYIDGECVGGPIIDEENVYIGSTDGLLMAFNKKNGTEKWKFKTEGSIEASPLVINNRVFIGDKDGTMYALDRHTGEALWTFSTDGSIVSAANGSGANRSLVIFGSHNDTLYACKYTDGSILWKYASDSYINGTPATDGERVVFGGCDGFIHLLSAEDGAPLGKIDVGAYVAGSIILDGKNVWAGLYNGKVICIDLDSMHISWAFQPQNRSDPFYAAPALSDRLLLAPSYDGFIYAVSRRDGTFQWKFATNNKINSSPIVAGDRIVIGSDDGRVYILENSDGTLVDSYDVGGAVSSPAVGGGLVAVGNINGRIHVFRGY